MHPILRIRGRFELVGAEDSKIFAWTRDFEHERNLKAAPLKTGHPDPVDSILQMDAALPRLWWVRTVVIDDEVTVDIEERAVVR